MIAPDHDRSFNLAAFDELVHGDTELGAFAVTEPANPRGQSLKMDPLFREFHPAHERFVFGKQFECELVCARDVLRLSAQCHPTKRAAPFAKKGANVFRNETGNVERVFDTSLLRLRANVIPVIKSDRAFLLQREHRLDVNRHGLHRAIDVFVRILSPQRERVLQLHSVRHIAVERVVRAGLVGQNIGNNAALHNFR